jgi:integrase
MRTDYIHKQELGHILAALMPPNRLVMELCVATGLRVSDVLGIKTEQIMQTSNGRITVRQLKTGKNRRVRIPNELLVRCVAMAGRYYVFAHRIDPKRHRTRQTVWKDVKRVVSFFSVGRLPAAKGLNLAPHSARKGYAVDLYRRTGDLTRVQTELNHDSQSVTVLYALADEMTRRRMGE